MEDQWNIVASERLHGLVRLPTVAREEPFAGASQGWNLDRAGTFAQAEAYLTGWLMTFAAQVATQDVVIDGRTLRNVWAYIPGRDSTCAVVLEGHYDVVAFHGNFHPAISDDGQSISGRGTSDMKGGLVTALLAVEDIVRAGQQPRLDTYIVMTCEEEVEALAIREFLNQKPDWCNKVEVVICLEPCFEDNEFRICLRHPGIACLEVTTEVPGKGRGKNWLQLLIETGDTPHASREPVHLDPNHILLKVLHQIPNSPVAMIKSDRSMDQGSMPSLDLPLP